MQGEEAAFEELFDLPLLPKRSSMVAVGDTLAPIRRGTPQRSLGNLTVSTIKRASLAPLQRLNSNNAVGALSSPIKRFSGLGAVDEDDKENVCPRASRYRFGQPSPLLYSSPCYNNQPAKKNREPVDFDALDLIVRSSPPSTIAPLAPTMQSEADELESLLFSTDVPPSHDFPDIFLGYGGEESEAESHAAPSIASSTTTATRLQYLKPAKSKIEVRVRASKKELPAMRGGSQLRKMILPGECLTPIPASSDLDHPADYSNFLSKLHADEPVESEPEDDEFKVGQATEFGSDEDSGDDDGEERSEPVIPKREIEGLFEDTQGVKPWTFPQPKEVDGKTTFAEIRELLKAQLERHYALLVQQLALYGQVEGGETQIPVATKLLVQLQGSVPSELLPAGLAPGLEALKDSFPEGPLRQACFSLAKNDAAVRPKSSIKSLGNLVFKHATEDDPCHLSPAYEDMLRLFGVEPSPFNPSASSLIDNNSNSNAINASANGVGKPRGKRNDSFMRCEDNLLLAGLKKYGLNNWPMIQSRLLPTRTTKQINVRFKNLVSRRAPPNPVKSLVQALWRPLSLAEEELIYRGVQRFGRDFNLISCHFLPHRPPTILRNLWEKLNELRRQSTSEAQEAGEHGKGGEGKKEVQELDGNKE